MNNDWIWVVEDKESDTLHIQKSMKAFTRTECGKSLDDNRYELAGRVLFRDVEGNVCPDCTPVEVIAEW